ncbi:uncharacterized protein PHALS_14828 [Plasmopara halstedii]|uniref:Uncharacterized protein n=1 Tax=Plasmopara halstedii TaxID=4781 RepID=A0A0P1AWJ6_PLAHL|nr:uncharacterized protein PHALS_14828 [Plasmopara halstedii]CEG45641.1 hypothetical protein PHALS_14828 [Plasmopara halstedii]|eukprot:XP_024582010.1 hypothetical protein PHALS_14828 [Plasmopara halstedii]
MRFSVGSGKTSTLMDTEQESLKHLVNGQMVNGIAGTMPQALQHFLTFELVNLFLLTTHHSNYRKKT